MKKTLTINLGGIVYHIDDDAYRLLDNYLSNLKHYFRKQEGAEEIVNDIEMRIAELFAEKVTEGKTGHHSFGCRRNYRPCRQTGRLWNC